MQKIKCSSCGTEFEGKFCPECGQSYVSVLKALEESVIPEGTPWWIKNKLVGSFQTDGSAPCNRMMFPGVNIKAMLKINEDGAVWLKIEYPSSTVEYIGVLKADFPNTVSLERGDGKGIGEGSAAQPRCQADIFRQSDAQISINSPALPHPIQFPGFSFILVRA